MPCTSTVPTASIGLDLANTISFFLKEKVMRRRQPVDLNDHLNANVTGGNPADFRVSLQPVYSDGPDGHQVIPTRRAIVREDTGQAIAVVSNRYVMVPHKRILDVIEQAIDPLDVGPVPRGIYVDRHGARMRAVFKFPSLASPVVGQDSICPCLQIRNTYDGSARIAVHIGAFRFVCTNLAVGGGGVFAGGFVSIHAGEIPIEMMAGQLADYLTRFDQIVQLYRQWSGQRATRDDIDLILKQSLQGRFDGLREETLWTTPTTVFDAYNRLTHHATHSMRSARTAFDMLERVNAGFQRVFPVLGREVIESASRDESEPQVAAM